MAGRIAIRRETKSPWERRSPVTPELARRLVHESEVDVLIQPSSRRVFNDKEYARAGAKVAEDLSEAKVVLGVKEIPPELIRAGTAYVFFSHVIKGQPYNMPMLARLMELGCTLIDYERVCDASGGRLIFFGRFAGLAGMIDSLWALGARLRSEGIRTPLSAIEPAHTYASLVEAKAAVRDAGKRIASTGLPPEIRPLVVGIAGYGNVARGVREILSELPTRELDPEDGATQVMSEPSPHCVYQVTYREEHLVESTDPGRSFTLQDYYDNPHQYRSTFHRRLPILSVLMNCTYWDARYPRLVTVETLRALSAHQESPRLRVIGDLGCDVGGAIQCTVKCTDPGDPVYVYDVNSGEIDSGVSGRGPVILAVDILPSELPREASEEFASSLAPFLPSLAKADFSLPFQQLEVPPEIKNAVIVHRGRLTPDYSYLEAHLASAGY